MKRTLRTGFGCLLLAVVFFFCGCANLGLGRKTNNAPPSEQAYAEGQGSTAAYLDFGDVLIPDGLKIDTKKSFVIRSSGLTTGVLVLKGRVEQRSLIDFFEANMAKDSWQLITSFKLPRTLMLYRKDARWCVINIYEGRFSTKVEIWVSPTQDGQNSGLLR